MEKLQEFLKNRGLTGVFKRFQEDKIDEKVILELTDEELEDYVPVKGDRVSLRVFARKQEGETSVEQRKLELLKALQPKARQKNTDHHSSHKQSLVASKTDCAITVGFCISIGNSFRQVRAPLGGGIRQLTVALEDIPTEFVEEDTLAWLDMAEVQVPPYSDMADLNDTQSIVKEIKLHRGNVFQDFVDFFSLEENRKCRTTTFEAKMLKENGEIEIAEDNGGVMRDALSEFYQTFYLQCTTGNTASVPVLRHDMDSTQWGAVAEVLHLAYRQENMFPVKIAMPFMQQVLFGKGSNPMEAFMQMIPECDRVLLEDALASNSFSSVDEEELYINNDFTRFNYI